MSLKAANRNAFTGLSEMRQRLQEASVVTDEYQLSLENLEYRRRHLEKEIQLCREFATTELDKINFIPLEELSKEEASRFENFKNKHLFQLERLLHEKEAREKLEDELRERKKRLQLLRDENQSKKSFLDSLPSRIALVVDTIQEACGDHMDLNVGQKRVRSEEALTLPSALQDLYFKFESYIETEARIASNTADNIAQSLPYSLTIHNGSVSGNDNSSPQLESFQTFAVPTKSLESFSSALKLSLDTLATIKSTGGWSQVPYEVAMLVHPVSFTLHLNVPGIASNVSSSGNPKFSFGFRFLPLLDIVLVSATEPANYSKSSYFNIFESAAGPELAVSLIPTTWIDACNCGVRNETATPPTSKAKAAVDQSEQDLSEQDTLDGDGMDQGSMKAIPFPAHSQGSLILWPNLLHNQNFANLPMPSLPSLPQILQRLRTTFCIHQALFASCHTLSTDPCSSNFTAGLAYTYPTLGPIATELSVPHFSRFLYRLKYISECLGGLTPGDSASSFQYSRLVAQFASALFNTYHKDGVTLPPGTLKVQSAASGKKNISLLRSATIPQLLKPKFRLAKLKPVHILALDITLPIDASTAVISESSWRVFVCFSRDFPLATPCVLILPASSASNPQQKFSLPTLESHPFFSALPQTVQNILMSHVQDVEKDSQLRASYYNTRLHTFLFALGTLISSLLPLLSPTASELPFCPLFLPTVLQSAVYAVQSAFLSSSPMDTEPPTLQDVCQTSPILQVIHELFSAVLDASTDVDFGNCTVSPVAVFEEIRSAWEGVEFSVVPTTRTKGVMGLLQPSISFVTSHGSSKSSTI